MRARADINLTPLIDVLLVLIVIFAVGLPIHSREAPTASQLPLKQQTTELAAPHIGQIMLEYSADGLIAVNHVPIALAELEARLRTIYADRHDKTLFIAGAPSLHYGVIVSAIDAAKGAGVERVGIVTAGLRQR